MLAWWLSNVNSFGLDTVFDKPWDSKKSSSSFKTAEPVFFNIPIPLVEAEDPKFTKLSVPAPLVKAPVESDIAAPVPDVAPTLLPPCVPPTLIPFLV